MNKAITFITDQDCGAFQVFFYSDASRTILSKAADPFRASINPATREDLSLDTTKFEL
jgi:hypothetical protein